MGLLQHMCKKKSPPASAVYTPSLQCAEWHQVIAITDRKAVAVRGMARRWYQDATMQLRSASPLSVQSRIYNLLCTSPQDDGHGGLHRQLHEGQHGHATIADQTPSK